MRKSERIRQLELQVLRLEFEVELVQAILENLVGSNYFNQDLEAGKWYRRKLDE